MLSVFVDDVNDDAKENTQGIQFKVGLGSIDLSNQFWEADTKEYIIYNTRFHRLSHALSPVEIAYAQFLSDWRLGQMLTSNLGGSNSFDPITGLSLKKARGLNPQLLKRKWS